MMLTVTNNLATHLIIPGGLVTGKSLILRPKGTPKGTVQVEATTGPLRDAERNGLVAIQGPDAGEPPGNGAGEQSVADPGPDPEEKEELLSQFLALVRDGKTQRETAQVEATTGPLSDAERNGLVTIQDSGGAKEPEDDSVREAPAAGRTGRTGRTGPKPKGKKKRLQQVRLQQILALAGEGKFQREIAQALGITRNVVQKALDKHRMSSAPDKE